MTAASVLTLHRELDRRAENLVREFRSIPAGAVMRAFARAVGDVRRAGGAWWALPDEAEARARRVLDGR